MLNKQLMFTVMSKASFSIYSHLHLIQFTESKVPSAGLMNLHYNKIIRAEQF